MTKGAVHVDSYTYSGWLTHISGHPSAAGRAQDRESSPARDRRSTTVPRHQPGGRLPLLSDRLAVTPAILKRAATNFAVW